MKALSIMPFWAGLVLFGEKTVECRTWKTDYRGDLLICASSRRESGFISGMALCVVTLADIVPFTEKHLEAACMLPEEMPEKPSWAWVLEDVGQIEPFPVKGKLHLFDVDDELIQPLWPIESSEHYEQVMREHYLPHVYFAKGDNESREIWSEICGCEVR